MSIKLQRSAPNSPEHLPAFAMPYEAADRVFTKAVISKTSFNPFDVATLRKVCEAREVVVRSTRIGGGCPTKTDYIKALFAQREIIQNNSTRGMIPSAGFTQIITPSVAPMDVDEETGQTVAPDRNQTLPPIIIRVGVKRAQRVIIRVFENPKDWQYLAEKDISLESNGDLNLTFVKEQFGKSGRCRAIDPKNFKPFFDYKPGYVLAEDLQYLLKDGYLRVVFVVQ